MRHQRIIIPLIVAVAVAAYANSLRVPFIFDDAGSIPGNPYIRQLWPLTDSMNWSQDSTVAARPIVIFSFALNYALGGLDVRGYHVVNLLIHILNALLLFGIIRRTLQRSNAPTLHAPRSADWIAAAIALIWVAHPLQTEAVTYIVQRTELLFAFFLLLTLYCVIRGHDSQQRGAWYATAVISCALGMGCKEVMAVAPVLVLFYDRIFLSQNWRDLFRQRGFLHAGLMMTWLIWGALLATNPHSRTAGFGFGDVSALDGARTQCGIIAHYLRLCFMPTPLVLDYYDWPIARSWKDAWLQVILILALLGATVWALWRKPSLGFLGVCFFLILAPTSSFIVLHGEMAAERRMYLPLAAVAAVVVISGWHILQRINAIFSWSDKMRTQTAAILLCVALLSLVWGTIHRNDDYKTELNLWRKTVAQRPNNARAHHNLSVELGKAEQYGQMALHRQRAGELSKEFAAIHAINDGLEAAREGRLEKAVEFYEKALRFNPDSPEAHSNLALTLLRQEKFPEAEIHATTATRLDPYSARALNNLGLVFARQEKFAPAIEQFRRAQRLERKAAVPRTNLGNVFLQQGDLEGASEQFREAIQLQPDYAEPYVGLAKIAVRDGKIDDATRLAQRACELDNFSQPSSLDVLASAYAAAGRFDEAVDAAQKAATLAANLGRDALAREIETRLKLYRAGQPHREKIPDAGTLSKP